MLSLSLYCARVNRWARQRPGSDPFRGLIALHHTCALLAIIQGVGPQPSRAPPPPTIPKDHLSEASCFSHGDRRRYYTLARLVPPGRHQKAAPWSFNKPARCGAALAKPCPAPAAKSPSFRLPRVLWRCHTGFLALAGQLASPGVLGLFLERLWSVFGKVFRYCRTTEGKRKRSVWEPDRGMGKE